MKYLPVFWFFLLGFIATLSAQKTDHQLLKTRIESYKADPRGPYKDIRWFCKDGTFAMPKESCAKPGGVQRARYKDEVTALAKSDHIFLGQILSTTPNEDFWDAENYHSRLKQYQLEKFLRAADEGWILQKGQFYRGAYQIEDEEAWGIDFLIWMLGKESALQNQFFLLRQAVKDIPHRGDDHKTLNVRALSKTISESYPAFMDLRVKIHGQPEASDLPKVKAFKEKHQTKLSAAQLKNFDVLIADMESVYQAIDLSTLNRFLKGVPKEAGIYGSLEDYIQSFQNDGGSPAMIMATAEKIAEIRQEILNVKSRKARLALLDLSIVLEEIYFKEINTWQPSTIKEAADKICYTSTAAYGTGLIEAWEWDQLQEPLNLTGKSTLTVNQLNTYVENARSLIEWGTGMVNGVYKDVVNLYGGFEPLAYGFFDDRIRSSVLLPLGNTVSELGQYIAKTSNLTNKVMDLPNQSTLRGLNPGFAMGELVVVAKDNSEIEVEKDKIYVFYNPPADLKPVAGIMTVTEGNMVSHVQLLARNLGIPNAVLSAENMNGLLSYSGQKVFYAVSKGGTVIMKPVAKMNSEERQLFAEKKRSEERITVPIEKIDLSRQSVLNMRTVNAAASGKICGPKAANLGQLKAMFPEKVVEGLVLPFGIFRKHMDQAMPGQQQSYWEFLNHTFNKAKALEQSGKSEQEVEAYTLAQLETLREAIKKMQLTPSFVTDLENNFSEAFGKKMGEIPVFLRSDTNMEDLVDFTGAGLNLTLFNVVDKDKIIQGIKDVWASPYTERSLKWRQRYLLNPENVFPSILIIPSVDVDYSGVMITTGIPTNDNRDLTIAFSRGAGGAVDGQAAESYLLAHDGQNKLLAPAREPVYRSLPATGGSKMNYTTFANPILNAQNLYDLRVQSYEIQKQIPAQTGAHGPYDIELGFKDNQIWLFQIRPFVENKNAVSSGYLESISPTFDDAKPINLNNTLK